MTKLLKKIITMLLVVTCLVGTFAGCSSSSNENETKEAVTTAKKVEETTTEAPTEEPTTTKYQPKGCVLDFEADSLFAKYFSNKILNPGDKIVINEVCEQSLSAVERGSKVGYIIMMIYGGFYNDLAVDFADKYLIPGSGTYEFTYEENFVIEYEGDKPIMFEVVKEEEGMVYIDIYLLD